MPQVEIKYSSDLCDINFEDLFTEIENVINDYDSSAGACKSRAYSAEPYHHTHIYISILMLKKDHRDDDFMTILQKKLIVIVKKYLPRNCYYSLELGFSGKYYFTDESTNR